MKGKELLDSSKPFQNIAEAYKMRGNPSKALLYLGRHFVGKERIIKK